MQTEEFVWILFQANKQVDEQMKKGNLGAPGWFSG